MDTVYAVEENENEFPLFSHVIKRGGHSTYRIVLQGNISIGKFEIYIKPLNDLGCTYEGFKERQYSLDVPPETDIYEVFDLLDKGENDEIWYFASSHIGHQVKEAE